MTSFFWAIAKNEMDDSLSYESLSKVFDGEAMKRFSGRGRGSGAGRVGGLGESGRGGVAGVGWRENGEDSGK